MACRLAIARWLHDITRLREVIPGKKRVRTQLLVSVRSYLIRYMYKAYCTLAIDIVLCVGLPILAMILCE